jgi:hypothetical protein
MVKPDSSVDPDAQESSQEVSLSVAIEDVPVKTEPTPLPWRELSVVLVIVISEGAHRNCSF